MDRSSRALTRFLSGDMANELARLLLRPLPWILLVASVACSVTHTPTTEHAAAPALPARLQTPHAVTSGRTGPDGSALPQSVGRFGRITEFPLRGNNHPGGITAGPDGAVWFTEPLLNNRIGRITTSGKATFYNVPQPGGVAWGITAGPDGALWFAMGGGVGRISVTGIITYYATGQAPCDDIALGPDGALWLTQSGSDRIGRLTTSGQFTSYSLPQNARPLGITAGPDGALWFTERVLEKIGRMTTAGSLTEYPLGHPGDPRYIVKGSDGALWFTEHLSAQIGRITTSGTITEYTIPLRDAAPLDITAGPDGALWFTVGDISKIGRITTSGQITLNSAPTRNPRLSGITVGPDRALWFAEEHAGKIGRLQLLAGS
jgi:virginiamycin B lyase